MFYLPVISLSCCSFFMISCVLVVIAAVFHWSEPAFFLIWPVLVEIKAVFDFSKSAFFVIRHLLVLISAVFDMSKPALDWITFYYLQCCSLS